MFWFCILNKKLVVIVSVVFALCQKSIELRLQTIRSLRLHAYYVRQPSVTSLPVYEGICQFEKYDYSRTQNGLFQYQ